MYIKHGILTDSYHSVSENLINRFCALFNSVFFVSKMSVLQKLADLSPNKPYFGFTKLTIGFHQIIHFKSVKNKFDQKKGDKATKSVLAELKDQVVFLPAYISQKLSESDLRELNATIKANGEIYLHFGGKHDHGG